jgi:hypothetical protein
MFLVFLRVRKACVQPAAAQRRSGAAAAALCSGSAMDLSGFPRRSGGGDLSYPLAGHELVRPPAGGRWVERQTGQGASARLSRVRRVGGGRWLKLHPQRVCKHLVADDCKSRSRGGTHYWLAAAVARRPLQGRCGVGFCGPAHRSLRDTRTREFSRERCAAPLRTPARFSKTKYQTETITKTKTETQTSFRSSFTEFK